MSESYTLFTLVSIVVVAKADAVCATYRTNEEGKKKRVEKNNG
jgi:hypothetical protein